MKWIDREWEAGNRANVLETGVDVVLDMRARLVQIAAWTSDEEAARGAVFSSAS